MDVEHHRDITLKEIERFETALPPMLNAAIKPALEKCFRENMSGMSHAAIHTQSGNREVKVQKFVDSICERSAKIRKPASKFRQTTSDCSIGRVVVSTQTFRDIMSVRVGDRTLVVDDTSTVTSFIFIPCATLRYLGLAWAVRADLDYSHTAGWTRALRPTRVSSPIPFVPYAYNRIALKLTGL